MPFNIEAFRRKRKIKYWAGSVLFWAGLFMIPVDTFSSFPTPIRGEYVLAIWVPMAVIGGILYFLSKKLPVEEAMGIAREHENRLTVTELVSELGVNLNTAEAILETLRRRGYVKAQKQGDLTVWIFKESRDERGIRKDKKIVDSETGMTEAQLDEFLEPCEKVLGELQGLLKELKPKSTFKESVSRFCDIVRQHIDNFRDDPSDVENFKAFPDHLKKEHIRLSKHDDREVVHETLYQIEDTAEKAASSLDVMLNRLLSNDLEKARAEAKTMERLLDLDRKIT